MASGTMKANLKTVMRSVSISYDIPATSQWSSNLYTAINADCPAGYTVLGTVGFTTNDWQVYPISIRYVDSQYSVQLYNASSNRKQGAMQAYYLAIKL